jgi:hypothetical protein
MATLDTYSTTSLLPSVYDEGRFSEADFIAERDRVHAETAIEREWMDKAEIESFATDADILEAAEAGQLLRVTRGVGFIAIDRLLNWGPSRSNPDHNFYYSAPYLRPAAAAVLEDLGRNWQDDMGLGRLLSVTSMGRSDEYQAGLRTRNRKLTIVNENERSSHQGLIAFDIDGCGLVEVDDAGEIRKINPRYPDWNPLLVEEGAVVLRHLLARAANDGILNYVEELPGTEEHCFHVCVNPTV